jgi:hypothetical protein
MIAHIPTQNIIAIVLMLAAVCVLSLTGCVSLGSDATPQPPGVQRLEIWVHQVDSPDPVFEQTTNVPEPGVSPAPPSPPGLGNGQIELTDLLELISDAQRIKTGQMPLDEAVAKAVRIYDALPKDSRADTLVQVLNMAGIGKTAEGAK